jgi:hypothetical protein
LEEKPDALVLDHIEDLDAASEFRSKPLVLALRGPNTFAGSPLVRRQCGHAIDLLLGAAVWIMGSAAGQALARRP